MLQFASSSHDRTLKVWDFESCRTDLVINHIDKIKSCGWHPTKGLIAAGTNDRAIKFWDPREPSCLLTLNDYHKHYTSSVEWSPNGNWLLSASGDTTCKILDIRTMTEVQTFKGINLPEGMNEVNVAHWHPFHESLFASATQNGSICYYDTSKDTPVNSIAKAHDAAIFSLAWHPNGHMIITGGNDKCIKYWIRNKPGDSNDNRYWSTTFSNLNMGMGGMKMDLNSSSSVAMIPGLGEASAGLSAFPVQAPEPTNMRVSRPVPEGYICKICNDTTHWITDCPMNGVAGQRLPGATYLCKICNKGGHWITDCPDKPPPPAGKRKRNH